MLSRRQPDLRQPPTQITNDDKFFARLLSKDSSLSNPSFRIYYSAAAAAAVPFLWESHPGTPKHATSSSPLPPLTPPPSSYISPQNPPKFPNKKLSFYSILPKTLSARKKSGKPPPSPPASLSCSSSLSSFSSNSKSCDGASDEGMSPTSALCFGERRRAGGKGGGGCYSMGVLKSMLMAIVGLGSA